MKKPNLSPSEEFSKISNLSSSSDKSHSSIIASHPSYPRGFHFLDDAYEAKDNLIHIDNYKLVKKMTWLKFSFVVLPLALLVFLASNFHNISSYTPGIKTKNIAVFNLLNIDDPHNPFKILATENNVDFSLFSLSYSQFLAQKDFFSKTKPSKSTNIQDVLERDTQLEKFEQQETAIFELLHEEKKYQTQLDFYFQQMKNEKNPQHIRQQFFYEFVFLVKAHQQFNNSNLQLYPIKASYVKIKELEYAYLNLVEHNVMSQLTLTALIVASHPTFSKYDQRH